MLYDTRSLISDELWSFLLTVFEDFWKCWKWKSKASKTHTKINRVGSYSTSCVVKIKNWVLLMCYTTPKVWFLMRFEAFVCPNHSQNILCMYHMCIICGSYVYHVCMHVYHGYMSLACIIRRYHMEMWYGDIIRRYHVENHMVMW